MVCFFKQRSKPLALETEKIKGVPRLPFFKTINSLDRCVPYGTTFSKNWRDYKKLSEFKDAARFEERIVDEIGEILRDANSSLIDEYLSLLVNSGQAGKAERLIHVFIDRGLANRNMDTVFNWIKRNNIGSSDEYKSFIGLLPVEYRKGIMIDCIRKGHTYRNEGMAECTKMSDLFKKVAASVDEQTIIEVVRDAGIEAFVVSNAIAALPVSHREKLIEHLVKDGLAEKFLLIMKHWSNRDELEGVLNCLSFLMIDAKQPDIFRPVIERLIDVLANIVWNDSHYRHGEVTGYVDETDEYGYTTLGVPVHEFLKPNKKLAGLLLVRIRSEFSLNNEVNGKISKALEKWEEEQKENKQYNQRRLGLEED